MTPSTRTGQAMQASSEGSLGVTTLAQSGSPKEVQDANAGLFIPRTQVNAAVRKRINERLDLGLSWDHGFAKGAKKLSPDQPDLNNENVYGAGVAMFYSAATGDPNFSVGISAELMVYSIPYVEYRTCVDLCSEGTVISHDRDNIAVASLGIIPSYKKDQWTFFGGFTLRNHPTIRKGDVDNGILIGDDQVDEGNMNIVANAGAEIEFGNGFRAMMHVYQTLTADPVIYKPTLGVGVTIPLSE